MNPVFVTELNKSNLNKIFVKSYLPFAVKKHIINTILKQCVQVENGISKVDYAYLKMCKDMALVAGYTNIELSLETEIDNLYDELIRKGIVRYVYEKMNKSELKFIEDILNKEIEQILSVNNSLPVLLVSALNSFVEKLPDDQQMASILSEMKNIDPNALSLIQSLLNWDKKNA